MVSIPGFLRSSNRLAPALWLFIVAAHLFAPGCGSPENRLESDLKATPVKDELAQRIRQYAPVRLEADVSKLASWERQMIPLLIEAAEVMDDIFFEQAFPGRRRVRFESLTSTERRYLEINYGPWDRLDDNRPFIEGVGPKPLGANFYPADMGRDEFEQAVLASPDRAGELRSLYTVILRDGLGNLLPRAYRVHYQERLEKAARLLEKAASIADDPALEAYLRLRAQALRTDDYRPSDLAWLDMKSNRIDIVIGPIETYEDRLLGLKAAYEAYVLVKDLAWSERLERYTSLLPELQQSLPVAPKYKQESPGTGSDLNAYDVIYYAGDCNAGSKTIAINLPNDEEVQKAKGSRRLQLKNAMRAKFDRILVPIADLLIAPEQRRHVTFDAFFANTMFHEVAHGLGIRETINGRGTVREALGANAGAIEEGKADILGLFLVEKLREKGHVSDGTLLDNYVTFLAGIFRSIRFGAASAHGRANMVRFHFFRDKGAFERDPATGTYRVVPERMRVAVAELSRILLEIQGDGDATRAAALLEEKGTIDAPLDADLARIDEAGIPVDVVFEQGLRVLGLEE